MKRYDEIVEQIRKQYNAENLIIDCYIGIPKSFSISKLIKDSEVAEQVEDIKEKITSSDTRPKLMKQLEKYKAIGLKKLK